MDRESYIHTKGYITLCVKPLITVLCKVFRHFNNKTTLFFCSEHLLCTIRFTCISPNPPTDDKGETKPN